MPAVMAAIQCSFILKLSRKPGKVVPVHVRQGVVAIQARQTAVRGTVVQIPESQLRERTPAQYTADPDIRGTAPLGGYAAHSPRFPFGESRARQYQYTFDKAL